MHSRQNTILGCLIEGESLSNTAGEREREREREKLEEGRDKRRSNKTAYHIGDVSNKSYFKFQPINKAHIEHIEQVREWVSERETERERDK